MSLAGTKTPENSWTEKEIEEQELVTNSIVEGLKNSNCTNLKTDGPNTIKAGKIEHLRTLISCDLKDKKDWTKVVQTLHPTPAVCGIPKLKAMDYIQQLENHDRQFYTGFIGIVKEDKKDLFVNLRCMQHFNGFAKLYLGGGITAPSDEEAEWLETEKKGMTLGSIL